MTPTKLNRAPLTKRISALAFTAAAALTLAVSSPSAYAATKEFTALQVALSALFPAQTVNNATTPQLQAALSKAITDNPKLKPGFIAGEALKNAGSNAIEPGDDLALALKSAAPSVDPNTLAKDAIKRAGSGKDLNVAQVPEFSQEFQTDNLSTYTLAKLVLSTKPGTGAVIGGRAAELATASLQEQLVNGALASKKNGGASLGAAATDITKWTVMVAVGDTAVLTNNIAGANVTLASKIGTGGVAGDPTNGGDIVDALLKNASLPKLKTGISPFITSVGKVADIEEMSKIAIAVGTQVATPAGKTTAIKFSAANGVVKALAKAIVAKATTNTSVTNPNSWENKQDEIGEVAAYMVGKILNAATVQGTGGGKPQVTAKNAGAKILAIIVSAVNATKPKKVQTAAGPSFYSDVAQDVAGSVAETLGALRDLPGSVIEDEFFDIIKAFLVKKVNNIGGKANGPAVLAAINAAYAPGADLHFEDGTLLPNALVSDYPETDFRPF
jgi:hypothetical protein